jgi:hypothetical protein
MHLLHVPTGAVLLFCCTAAFATYSLLGYRLTPDIAFPALALFNLLRFPVLVFPSQVCE